MYIRDYMKTPVITVTKDTLVDDALRIMYEKKVRRLPVIEGGKLVGLVTRRLLSEAVPESPMPLSIWGAHYQLSKMRVQNVMKTDIITITPDTTVEAAATLAEQHKIGTLPVVDKKHNLVGIITGTDLYHLLTQVLGFGKTGVRLHIKAGTKDIQQLQILEIMIRHKVNVLSAFPTKPASTQQEGFIIHLDTKNAGAIVEDLKKLGLSVEEQSH
ncbi:CBS domain-containing protein [Chloroflexota bacterium]